MKAIRSNKEYTISEQQKEFYLKEGYDIIDDKGKIIEYSPKKTVKYAEYKKIKDELEALKANPSQNTEIEKTNEKLTKEVEKLTKANEELTKTNEEFTKQNTELTEENKKLAKK